MNQPATPKQPIENMRRLGPALYIVWTQAGFNKAIKDLRRRHDDDECPVEGYPKQYPCVVAFYGNYSGYHYWSARCTPLSSEIERTRKVLDLLITADAEHMVALKTDLKAV